MYQAVVQRADGIDKDQLFVSRHARGTLHGADIRVLVRARRPTSRAASGQR